MSLFCTLAMGKRYADQARYLVADLEGFGARILVLTDHPKTFRCFRNAVTRPYYPERFSYHLKRTALREALLLEPSVTFIDADGVLRHGVPKAVIQNAVSYRFPPGFHGSKIRTIKEAGKYVYPDKEALGSSWGIEFDRDSITYQEMLFNLTMEEGKEESFLGIWDRFATAAETSGESGKGEGTCIGIAAHGSGLTLHGSNHMDASLLSKVFWHCSLDFRLRPYHQARQRLLSAFGLVKKADLEKSALYHDGMAS